MMWTDSSQRKRILQREKNRIKGIEMKVKGSSFPASHPLESLLAPASLRFQSTSKHLISIPPSLRIHLQVHALLSLPASQPLPTRAAGRHTHKRTGMNEQTRANTSGRTQKRVIEHAGSSASQQMNDWLTD